jgi:hypothetical protein
MGKFPFYFNGMSIWGNRSIPTTISSKFVRFERFLATTGFDFKNLGVSRNVYLVGVPDE